MKRIPNPSQQQQGHSPNISAATASNPSFTVTFNIGGGIGGVGVVLLQNHGILKEHCGLVGIKFATTGTLPTGVAAATPYYPVYDANFNDNQFAISATPGGPAIVMTGTQAPTNTLSSISNQCRVVRIKHVVEEAYVVAANGGAAKAAAKLLTPQQWIKRKVSQIPNAVSAGPGNALGTGSEDVWEYIVSASDDGL